MRILAIDGGGIRGVYPAAFLAALEKNGIKLGECFDMVAGTSTGSIVALALAYEKSMAEVSELYCKHAKTIFPQIFPFKFLPPVFRAKYGHNNLTYHLRLIFGDTARFMRPRCEVRVQAYDATSASAKIFAAGPQRGKQDLRIWQVATASCSAPTYFPSFKIGKAVFVDGGIWANNPALVAVAEALKLNKPLDSLKILSIGCGSAGAILRSDKPRKGFLDWWNHLVPVVFHSQSEGMHALTEALKPKSGRLAANQLRYYQRFNPGLSIKEAKLDSTSCVNQLAHLGDMDGEEFLDEFRQIFLPSNS